MQNGAAPLVLLALLALVGCRGKDAQCKDFIAQANDAVSTVDLMDERAANAGAACSDPLGIAGRDERCGAEQRRAKFVALHEEADKVEFEAKKLSAVDVKDAKLVALKASLVGQLNDLAAVSRDMARLLDEKRKTPPTSAEAEAIVARGKTVQDKEKPLTDEINAYCGAK